MKTIKKIINNLKIKRDKSLYYKIMLLKKELKETKDKLKEYKEVNHQLIDVITIHNIRIREVFLNK